MQNKYKFIHDPLFEGSGLININKAAKYLSVNREKIEKLINCGLFGYSKARNGGKMLNFRQVYEVREMITDPSFPNNAPKNHKKVLIDLFMPEDKIIDSQIN